MPRPYIYSKWYDTKTYNLLKVLGGFMPPPYFYCKWSDTPYLLSAEGGLMPPPIYVLD